MSKYSDIDALAEEMNSKLTLLADRILDAMNAETIKAMDAAYTEFGTYQQSKITQIFNQAVDDFYSAYTPKGYVRTYGLYDVLDMQLDSSGMVITNSTDYKDLFDQTKLHTDRSGGSLFDKVFMQGYHGGAESISGDKAKVWGSHPLTGTPYYRTGGYVKYPGSSSKKYHKYGKWGRPAVKTESPYNMIKNRLSIAEETEIFEEFKNISQKHNDAAVENVKRDIPKYQAEIYG